jgi:hydroxyacylglutathione hydrolase
MLVKRFYDDGLAQASWMIGCQATGDAIVIDPNRDVAQYLEAAESEELRIAHVSETHIHADFVSGARELARAAGARLYLSAEGGEEWQYTFADADGATLLRDGGVIEVGNIRLDIWHTPGHTPEHICFLVTDRAGADAPMGILTGDFVFVGDVGRPDLLEKAAGVANTMRAGAASLFRSLERFRTLPDYVQIWPGHGAGSACGKALGAVPQSTVGYERLFNPGVAITDEAEFVEWVLEGQPEPPKYFAQMKRINRDGPAILGSLPRPECLADDGLADFVAANGIVVDTRHRDAYAAASVPGTLCIPLNRSFTTWAGWLVPYDTEFRLIAEDAETAEHAARELAMIGLDRVSGFYRPSAIEAWSEVKGMPPATMRVIDITTLPDRVDDGDDAFILDVRGANEWAAGRLPYDEARLGHIPLGYLAERLAELPPDRSIYVQCGSGARSAIAISVLARHGISDTANLDGGIEAWRRAGFDVVRGERAEAGVA